MNEPYYLEALVSDGAGNPVEGLEISYKVTKLPSLLVEEGKLVDIGSGLYQKQIKLGETGQFRILYHCSTEGYPDQIETIIVEQDSFGAFFKRFKKYYPF